MAVVARSTEGGTAGGSEPTRRGRARDENSLQNVEEVVETWEVVLRQKRQRAAREGGGEIPESRRPVGRGLCRLSCACPQLRPSLDARGTDGSSTPRGQAWCGHWSRRVGSLGSHGPEGQGGRTRCTGSARPNGCTGHPAHGRASAEEGEQEGREGARDTSEVTSSSREGHLSGQGVDGDCWQQEWQSKVSRHVEGLAHSGTAKHEARGVG